MNLYYVGAKSEFIKNSNYFSGSIVLYGDIEAGVSYEKLYGKSIDANDMSKYEEISAFYELGMHMVESQDSKAKFMLYHPAGVEDMTTFDNVVCLNDINLLKQLNNKPECRELLKNEITLMQYQYVQGKEINFERINELFQNKFERYVVQQPVGFAGIGTFVLDKSNGIVKSLVNDNLYAVSGFVENANPLNNTVIISDKHIHVFGGSFQRIKEGSQLEYDGYDFEAYKQLPDNLKAKILKQTLKIAKKLQKLGYRGICGVDYLQRESDIYFMEINPRFQASSMHIDKELSQNRFPSIFELNYLAFYDENKFIEVSNNIKNKV